MNRTRACALAQTPSTDPPALRQSVHSAASSGPRIALALAAGLALSLAPASTAKQPDKPARPRLIDTAKPTASPAEQP